MLTFLFYTILGLVIFVPIVMFGTKLLAATDTKGFDSYDNLAGIISSIREGEIRSTPLYMGKKSVIVGFSKDADRFENYYHSSFAFFFDRPNTCEDSKACICLCPDYNFKETGKLPYSKECEKPRCRTLDIIDFLPERTRDIDGKSKYSWKGGFLYLRGLPASVNGLPSGEYKGISKLTVMGNTMATRTFYVERYGNVVSVCIENPLEIPCIPEEIKEQIDTSEAIEQSTE